MSYGKSLTSLQGYPRSCMFSIVYELFGEGSTLIFAIAALDLLMHIFLNVSFENSCSSRLIESSGFEDMCSVDPVVMPPSHYMFFEICAKLVFIDGNL